MYIASSNSCPTVDQFDTPFSTLPRELLHYIFSFLNINHVGALKLTCKEWHVITEDSQLTKYIFFNTWPYMRCAMVSTLEAEMPWRSKCAHYSGKKFQKTLSVGQLDCFSVQEDRVVTGDYRGVVQLWDLQTGDCIKKFHVCDRTDEALFSIAFHGELIACGGLDIVKIWDNATAKGYVFDGHSHCISAIVLQDQHVISGSWDATIRVRNIHDAQNGLTLNVGSQVLSLAVQENLVLGGVLNKNMKLFDMLTAQCVTNFEGSCLSMSRVCIQDNQIVSGGREKEVQIWDRRTGKAVRACTTTHYETVTYLAVLGDVIVSGSRNNIHVWNFKNNEEHTLLQEEGRCYAVQGDKLFKSGDQGVINVLPFEYSRNYV